MEKVLKPLLFLFFICLFFMIYAYDLQNYLTLDFIKSHITDLKTHNAEHPFFSIFVFLTLYISITGLLIPGSSILSLAAGALFGFTTGVIIVSFASTIGASISFLLVRFFLRDYVQSRFKVKLESINKELKKGGIFYLFSLRLIPVIPFVLVNILMALTPIRLSTFYIGSQLGMIPGTMVFVNAGLQLSQIESLKDIFSWKILLSFIALGIIPLVSKKMILFFKN